MYLSACLFLDPILEKKLIFSMFSFKQLIIDFVKKENIPIEGVCPAEVLLGRDTRPSGGFLLEAAKQVLIPPDHCEFYRVCYLFFFYINKSCIVYCFSCLNEGNQFNCWSNCP